MAGQCDGDERPLAVGPSAQIGRTQVALEALPGGAIETGDLLAERALTARERFPIVGKVAEIHSDQQ